MMLKAIIFNLPGLFGLTAALVFKQIYEPSDIRLTAMFALAVFTIALASTPIYVRVISADYVANERKSVKELNEIRKKDTDQEKYIPNVMFNSLLHFLSCYLMLLALLKV